MLYSLVSWAMFLVIGWATFFVAYQLALACLYFLVQEKPLVPSASQKRFSVIIPAHNEEIMIGRALDSWKKVDYPKELFAVYVIADNCTDRTAEVARLHGAVCYEREDAKGRGKGYALAWAVGNLPLDAYDAIVFVDADTTVCPEFLIAMNNRLGSRAKVIQGLNGILNPDDSGLTSLMQVTNVMKNRLFNHAKSRLGLSVPLMGTGMCFDRGVLQEVGWKAFSIGEDGEQFAYLAAAGIQVEYEPAAMVYAQEADSFRQAYTQRLRWVSGRMQLVGLGGRLFIRGLRKLDIRLIDAGLTLLTPNYVELADVTIGGILMTLLLDLPARGVLLPWFLFLLGGQGLYYFIAVAMGDCAIRGLRSLPVVPIFLVWRLVIDLVAVLHLKRSVWVRTTRVPDRRKEVSEIKSG